MTMAASLAPTWNGPRCSGYWRRWKRARWIAWWFTRGPPEPVAVGLHAHPEPVRETPGQLRGRHPTVQHEHVAGAADAQHPALVRAVREGADRRADTGQDVGGAAEGKVGGRHSGAWVRRGPARCRLVVNPDEAGQVHVVPKHRN